MSWPVIQKPVFVEFAISEGNTKVDPNGTWGSTDWPGWDILQDDPTNQYVFYGRQEVDLTN